MVHSAFCFCLMGLLFGWVDTHWSVCAVLTHTPDSPGSDLLIDSAYLTPDALTLSSCTVCQSCSVIFHSCSRTIQHLEHIIWLCPIEVQTVDFAFHSLLFDGRIWMHTSCCKRFLLHLWFSNYWCVISAVFIIRGNLGSLAHPPCFLKEKKCGWDQILLKKT